MDIGMVEMTSTVTGAVVTANEPRVQLGFPGAHQVSGGDVAVHQEKVKQMVEEMQNNINNINVSIQYSQYGDHGEKISVAVVNKDTGEVIREIPSQEIQDLYAKMSELAGMIFNRKI